MSVELEEMCKVLQGHSNLFAIAVSDAMEFQGKRYEDNLRTAYVNLVNHIEYMRNRGVDMLASPVPPFVPVKEGGK